MDDVSLPPHEERKRPEPLGPLVAPIIIVILLAVGALYVFIKHQQETRQIQVQEQENT
jgi:hypothetical protein